MAHNYKQLVLSLSQYTTTYTAQSGSLSLRPSLGSNVRLSGRPALILEHAHCAAQLNYTLHMSKLTTHCYIAAVRFLPASTHQI